MQKRKRGKRKKYKSKHPREKKLYWYTTFGVIEIFEQIFIEGRGGEIIRPFCESAEVSCRGYSIVLQRVITDFGSDISFGRIPDKLTEHYGITIPVSSAQKITKKHAEIIMKSQEVQTELPDRKGIETLIAEMDGSMVPIVEVGNNSGEESEDLRKTRSVGWKEARLALVRDQRTIEPTFGVTMGTVDDAGDQLANCAITVGATTETEVHSVGDGAGWISDQVDRVFGSQGSYLIDFYHLCDYLSAAGEVISGKKGKKVWMEKQKEKMKNNQLSEVLNEMEPYLEKDSVKNEDAPVRACYRYITNHSEYMNYKGALTANLPIGSGEIESGHRYIIQERLKIPGAWWKIKNAKSMLALRVFRANDNWESYWADIDKKAA